MKFQFIPSWRVDDVMVSYAPKGGSVGPHVDNYDVFLLQVAFVACTHRLSWGTIIVSGFSSGASHMTCHNITISCA